MLSSRFISVRFFVLKVLQKRFNYAILSLRHNLIFGQTMGEVFLFLVKTHSLFWLSLVVCQKLCRSKRSYAFFGVCNFGCTHFFDDKELIDKIKEYQKAHGLSSFVAAVRKLCRDALEIEKISH